MSIFQTIISLTALIISLISLGARLFTTDDWIAVFGKGKLSSHSSVTSIAVLVLIAVETYLCVGTVVMFSTTLSYVITFGRVSGSDFYNTLAYGIIAGGLAIILRVIYKHYDRQIGLIKAQGKYYRVLRLIDPGYLVDDFGRNPDDKDAGFVNRVILPIGIVTERGTQIRLVSQNLFYQKGFKGTIRESLDSAPKHI